MKAHGKSGREGTPMEDGKTRGAAGGPSDIKTAKEPDSARHLPRFALVGACAFALTVMSLRALGSFPFMSVPFLYFLVMVALTKLLGDTAYFLLSPGRREWARLDGYLLEDFLTFFRFGFPLAMAQAYALNTGQIPLSLLLFWLGPSLPVAVFLVNRWLVERGQDKRRLQIGGVPVVRGPETG
jgi:hypothetical protein